MMLTLHDLKPLCFNDEHLHWFNSGNQYSERSHHCELILVTCSVENRLLKMREVAPLHLSNGIKVSSHLCVSLSDTRVELVAVLCSTYAISFPSRFISDRVPDESGSVSIAYYK